jgi:Flp pilus assembly protein TadD
VYADAQNNLRRVLSSPRVQPAPEETDGSLLAQQGSFVEAIAAFRKTIDRRPDDPAAHLNLGHCYRALRNYEEALASYARVISLSPNDVEAQAGLATAWAGLGNFGQAERCYRRALHLTPDHVELHHNLGITLQRQGKLVQAGVSYRRALELRPDYARAWCSLGTVFSGPRRPNRPEGVGEWAGNVCSQASGWALSTCSSKRGGSTLCEIGVVAGWWAQFTLLLDGGHSPPYFPSCTHKKPQLRSSPPHHWKNPKSCRRGSTTRAICHGWSKKCR